MADDDSLDDKVPTPQLPTASLSKRIVAGFIDLGVLGTLCSLLFFLPFGTGGVALPMVVVLAVVLGYSVIPLWVFGTTLAMRPFGLQLVRVDGRPLELMDVLAREAVWRALLPGGFLVTLFGGFFAMLLRQGQLYLPMSTGLVVWLTRASVAFALLAVLGQLLAFLRADRRGLPDLISRTQVVPYQPRPLPADEDERIEARLRHRRHIRNVVIFQALLVLGIFVLPYVLTRSTQGRDAYVARLKRQGLEVKFRANPEDAQLTRQYLDVLWLAGEEAEAHKVEALHREALVQRDVRRVDSLREQLARNPSDEALIESLLELLEGQERLEEAKAVLQTYVQAEPTPDRRMTYALWLYRHDFAAEAVDQFQQVHKAGTETGETQGYLGLALKELGRTQEARVALRRALELDPELTPLEAELAELESPAAPPSRVAEPQEP